MKRLVTAAFAVVACVCVCGSPVPASAWELDLSGVFAWAYESRSQNGPNGFLGKFDVDNGAGGNASNLNFWTGSRFDTNLVTGSDAAWSYFNVELFPRIKVNEAIRFSGKYRLSTYGSPLADDYHTFDAPGGNRAFADGQWTMFWVAARTPWGTVGVGKRPWVVGTGRQYDGEDGATTESISLTVPYGPLDFSLAFYPWRRAGSSSVSGDDWFNISTNLAGDAGLPAEYFGRSDRSGSLSRDFRASVHYSAGAINAGIIGSFGAFHIGPEGTLKAPGAAAVALAQDSEFYHGAAYVKYFNGRFFFNSEGAWMYWTDRYADPTAAAGTPNPRYAEQWNYLVELGTVVGPAKLTLLHSWTPGPDRRNGILIDKQPAAFVRHDNFDRLLGSYDVLRPYSLLFAFNYGSGLNALSLNGNGYARDASAFAGRLDYAAAANLNLFGSLLWAQRTSKGYSWGAIGPNTTLFGGPVDGNLSLVINRYPASPNIPDTSLGYEVNVGLDWGFLDGWTTSLIGGYWQPGKWFTYACVDRSVAGWETGTPGNFFGTRPNRKIDPVIGAAWSMTFAF
ncbi:MAG: hypothetical protein AB1646_16850 [Thermodesulfobacteriota bacterium]